MQLAERLSLTNISEQSLIGMQSKTLVTFCLSGSKLYCVSDQFDFADVYATVGGHTLDWHSVCYC